MAFPDNCRYLFLILHWNSRSGSLKKSCNMELKTVSMSFSCSGILKSICPPCILNRSFTHSWFYNMMYSLICHLKNSSSLNLIQDIQLATDFIIKYEKKNTFFVTTTIDLIRKVFMLGSWQANGSRYKFSQTLIFTRKHRCYYW